MKHEEAFDVIKNKAGSKYSGKPLQLLTMLVRGYSGKNPKFGGNKDGVYPDIDDKGIPPLTRLVVNLCAKLGGIGPDQLRNVIKSVDEIEVVKWANGRIHFRLRNLDALALLPDFQKVIDAKHKARRAYQTEIARKRRAEIQRKANGQRAMTALLGLLYFRAVHRKECVRA
jgi:hypothetical protein